MELLLARFLTFALEVSIFPLQAIEIPDNYNQRSLYGSSLYDDDYESEIPRLWIPFCRRGHTQITGTYFNSTSGRTEIGVIVFGGEGINYFNPHESFLRDIWTLKVFENKDTLQYDFDWDLIVRKFRNDSIANWPERRSNFGSSFVPSSGNLVIYGGENRNRQIPDSSPFFGDYWAYLGAEHTWVQLPEAGVTGDDERRILTESSSKVSTDSTNSGNNNINYNSNSNNRGNEGIDINSDTNTRNVGESPATDSTAAGTRPGPRKDSLLVVLPLSNRLIVIGGDALSQTATYASGLKASPSAGGRSDSTSDSDSAFNRHLNSFDKDVDWSSIYSESASTQSSSTQSARHSPSQLGVSLGEDTSIFGGSNSANDITTGICMSDVFMFNSSVDTLAQRLYQDNIFDISDGPKSIKWTKMAKFPGFCLGGASATAVVDPTDGKEKVLVFGGRFASHKVVTQSRTLSNEADSSSSSSNRNRHGGFTGQQLFSYSNKLWIFDPQANEWTYEGPSPIPLAPGQPTAIERTVGVNWPYARDRHAATYHAESGTLFISGGRVSCVTALPSTTATTSSSSSSSTSSTSGSSTDAAAIACASASQFMDLWAYNLHSKRWIRLPPHPGMNSLKSTRSRKLLLLVRDQPDARYLHSMSILPASSVLDTPLYSTGTTNKDTEPSNTVPVTDSSPTTRTTTTTDATHQIPVLSDVLVVVFGGQFGKPWSTSPLGFQPRSSLSAASLDSYSEQEEGETSSFPMTLNSDSGGAGSGSSGGGGSSGTPKDIPDGGGGGGYFSWDRHTVFDDDAQGYPGLHAQANDLWVYTVSKEMLTQLTQTTAAAVASSTSKRTRNLQMKETKHTDSGVSVDASLYGWKMVSSGGCTAGADGK